MRRFEGQRLIIATHNAGKLREFQTLLGSYVNEIVPAGALFLPEPEETGNSFQENAVLKARAAAKLTNTAALADDSGLCVNALSGAPGIHSARWAGAKKDFQSAMRRVHDGLDAREDRSAYFIAVLALAWPDGQIETVEGRVDGTVVWPPRGMKGHGYDPIFVPQGEKRTFAEMEAEEKDRISHRGQAARELIRKFFL